MWKNIFIITVLLVLFGCNYHSTSPGDEYSAQLEIYYDNELVYNETLTESDDGQTETFDLPNNTEFYLEKYAFEYEYEYTLYAFAYTVLARKDGFYSNYFVCGQQDTIIVDASGVFSPISSGFVCGSILRIPWGPIEDEFYIFQDSLIVDSLTTNANGHFAIDIPFGDYQIGFKCLYPEGNLYDFIVNSFYINYFLPMAIVHPEKPNIYIYPEEYITLDVAIDFPHGGFITESIPEYGDGWKNFRVEPSGKINDEFTFLFYESQNPDLCQYKKGWVVAQEDLENFFIQNLTETGFEGQEIIDFTDFWIPILKDHPYYAIYPQYKVQYGKMVELEFSVKPDNLLRLIYAIEGKEDDMLILHEPEIPDFEREGFFAVEWGVIRKHRDENNPTEVLNIVKSGGKE